MKYKTFSLTRGIKLPRMQKDEKRDIIEIDDPKVFYVSMQQHKGKEATVVVEIGEKVKKGSVIGKSSQVSIFSPCSGVVSAIVVKPNALGGISNHVVIENDFKNTKAYMNPLSEINQVNVLRRIFEAGIVDKFGNPIYRQLVIEDGANIKGIIINCCSDEPYITNNLSLLANYAEEIIKASYLISVATGVKNIKFVSTRFSEEKSKSFGEIFKSKMSDDEYVSEGVTFDYEVVEDRYPIGETMELLFALFGERLIIGQSSQSLGYIVIDLSALLPVYRAVYDGIPDFERLVTLVGCHEFITEPYWIKSGTPIDFIVESSVSKSRFSKIVKIISGGPMKGVALSDTTVSVTKSQSSIMFLTDGDIYIEGETNCISCGKCNQICPRNLMPQKIDAAYEANDFVQAKRYGAEYCSECGCCSYICPAKRYIVQKIRECKEVIKNKGIDKWR